MEEPKKPSFREEDPAAAPGSSRMVRGAYKPEPVVNPPPKFLPVGYRVPPERMFDAVMAAFRALGIVVEGLDREAGLLRGNDPMGGGASALVIAALSPTDTGGTKVVLSYDRPPGTRMDPFADGKRLEGILAKVDEALAG